MGIINDVYSKWGEENEHRTVIEEDPRSLKSCLRKFGFSRQLQDLDDNLEAVRKHRISEDAHKEMIKAFDKKLLKLSKFHHPDLKSDTAGNMESHNNQATINAIRTLITRLSRDFLTDIDIDYRYEYYAYIDISTIGNEEDVDKLNLNLQYQLIMLSEIKHEKIIANIKRFLISCEECLDSYYKDDRRNFILNYNLALNRLKDCILGYQALTREFNNVEKECVKNHSLQNTLSTVKRMSADFERQSKILEKIKDLAKQSLKGNFLFYAEKNETMDGYFVLPFAKYINVLSMCNVMLGNTKRNWYDQTNIKINLDFSQLDGNDTERKYFTAYCLASYFDNPTSSNKMVIINLFQGFFQVDNFKDFGKMKFDVILRCIRNELKNDFNQEKHYIVRSVKKQTEDYNKDVQDFFEVMLRRKKSDIPELLGGQDKNRNDEKGKAMLLSQRIKYEKNISKLYPRKGASFEDFSEETQIEEKLLEKMKDNFKERGEKLKTKILQNEITNEKLREALDVYKEEEKVLLEKLSKFGSRNNEKLIDEIQKREEENRKLREELEIKREEERFLILKLCGKYEKISYLLEEKIQEIVNQAPEEESKIENTNFRNSNKQTDYQETKSDCEENMKEAKWRTDEGDQTSVFEMDRKSIPNENSILSIKQLKAAHELQKDNMKAHNLKLSSKATLQMFETEENNLKTLENETDKQKTCKKRLLWELSNQVVIPASVNNNTELKNVENNSQNMELAHESLKENNCFEASTDEIDIQISLQEHKTEDQFKNLPKTEKFDKQSSEFKISNNVIENEINTHEFETQVIRREKNENVVVFELQKECSSLRCPKTETQSHRCTYNFEENDRLKYVSRDGLIKQKSCTSLEKDDVEVKFNANYTENKLIKKEYTKEKASEIDMETARSYVTEHEKDRLVLEAIRNLKQNCKLQYQPDIENV